MPTVILLCGKVGSGKTAYAETLKKENRAVILSCDQLMLSLYEEFLSEQHQSALDKATAYLLSLAKDLAEADVNVVLDFGFWTKYSRQITREFFHSLGIHTELHYIVTNEETRRQRIKSRNAEIEKGEQIGYRIDDDMKGILDDQFEEPEPLEIDRLIRE